MTPTFGGRLTRREWLAAFAVLVARPAASADAPWTYAVTGRIPTASLGLVLTHEHVLVDFVGADRAGPHRYDAATVMRQVLPYLQALRAAGGQTLVECTPAFLGRDPRLLLELSRASGVTLLTNTGYYGAAQDKYVPAHAHTESAETLAGRWTREFEEGIDGTGIRPGFIKTGVDAGPLSPIDRKLVRAAALCHAQTGLTICCHSGDSEAALSALDTVRAEGVSADAFVWVHAQNETDPARHLQATRAGAWVSLDGIRPSSIERYARSVRAVIDSGGLERLLISQDAGWYRVGEPGGGEFTPYTPLLSQFLPALRAAGVSEGHVRTLTVTNPAAAFAVRKRVQSGRVQASAGQRSGTAGPIAEGRTPDESLQLSLALLTP